MLSRRSQAPPKFRLLDQCLQLPSQAARLVESLWSLSCLAYSSFACVGVRLEEIPSTRNHHLYQKTVFTLASLHPDVLTAFLLTWMPPQTPLQSPLYYLTHASHFRPWVRNTSRHRQTRQRNKRRPITPTTQPSTLPLSVIPLPSPVCPAP